MINISDFENKNELPKEFLEEMEDGRDESEKDEAQGCESCKIQ